MPASVSLAPPADAGLDGPKLRSSCDGCGTAKVKCDRGHPVCGRCSALGLTCAYGPSRKFGKPPRKRLGVDFDVTTRKRVCTSRPGHQRREHHVERPDPGATQNIDARVQADFSDAAADIHSLSYDIDSILDNSNEQHPLNPGFYPTLPFEPWLQLNSLDAGFEIPSASAAEAVRAFSANSGTRESHSCPRESYEVFRDLICPSDSLHAPESNAVTISAQLDLVLHMNKNAVDRLSRILKCPCAKTDHRAMVHASIISRILMWYQQAAGFTGSSSWGPHPSARADSSTFRSASSSFSPSPPPSGTADDENTASISTTPSLAQTTGFTVELVPVSMGTFSVEDQNVQAALRNQLVLSELKKTAGLIDSFVSLDTSGPSANGVTGLYSYLGVWLRGEHTRTIKILRSRLSTLNENLSS